MAIQEIEVADGMVLFPYFVKEEDEDLAIACFASKAGELYDEDRNLVEETLQDKARRAVKSILDRKVGKYQEKKLLKEARTSGTIKTNIIH